MWIMLILGVSIMSITNYIIRMDLLHADKQVSRERSMHNRPLEDDERVKFGKN